MAGGNKFGKGSGGGGGGGHNRGSILPLKRPNNSLGGGGGGGSHHHHHRHGHGFSKDRMPIAPSTTRTLGPSFAPGSGGGGGGGSGGLSSSAAPAPPICQEESFQLLPRPSPSSSSFALTIRLTPEILQSLMRAQEQGAPCSIKFGANPQGHVFKVDQEEFKFLSAPEPRNLCDIYEVQRDGEDGHGVLEEVGCVWRKVSIQRTLSALEKDRVKKRSEEAERKQKSRKAIILDHGAPVATSSGAPIEVSSRRPPFKPKSEPPQNKLKIATSPVSSIAKHRPPPTSSLVSKVMSPIPASPDPSNTRGVGALSTLPPAPKLRPQSLPEGPTEVSTNKGNVSDLPTDKGFAVPQIETIVMDSSSKSAGKNLSENLKLRLAGMDLRNILVTLLKENPKGMTLKVVEKVIGEALPNNNPGRKNIEKTIKLIASFHAPGRYLLNEGVELESCNKPSPPPALPPPPPPPGVGRLDENVPAITPEHHKSVMQEDEEELQLVDIDLPESNTQESVMPKPLVESMAAHSEGSSSSSSSESGTDSGSDSDSSESGSASSSGSGSSDSEASSSSSDDANGENNMDEEVDIMSDEDNDNKSDAKHKSKPKDVKTKDDGHAIEVGGVLDELNLMPEHSKTKDEANETFEKDIVRKDSGFDDKNDDDEEAIDGNIPQACNDNQLTIIALNEKSSSIVNGRTWEGKISSPQISNSSHEYKRLSSSESDHSKDVLEPKICSSNSVKRDEPAFFSGSDRDKNNHRSDAKSLKRSLSMSQKDEHRRSVKSKSTEEKRNKDSEEKLKSFGSKECEKEAQKETQSGGINRVPFSITSPKGNTSSSHHTGKHISDNNETPKQRQLDLGRATRGEDTWYADKKSIEPSGSKSSKREKITDELGKPLRSNDSLNSFSRNSEPFVKVPDEKDFVMKPSKLAPIGLLEKTEDTQIGEKLSESNMMPRLIAQGKSSGKQYKEGGGSIGKQGKSNSHTHRLSKSSNESGRGDTESEKLDKVSKESGRVKIANKTPDETRKMELVKRVGLVVEQAERPAWDDESRLARDADAIKGTFTREVDSIGRSVDDGWPSRKPLKESKRSEFESKRSEFDPKILSNHEKKDLSDLEMGEFREATMEDEPQELVPKEDRKQKQNIVISGRPGGFEARNQSPLKFGDEKGKSMHNNAINGKRRPENIESFDATHSSKRVAIMGSHHQKPSSGLERQGADNFSRMSIEMAKTSPIEEDDISKPSRKPALERSFRQDTREQEYIRSKENIDIQISIVDKKSTSNASLVRCDTSMPEYHPNNTKKQTPQSLEVQGGEFFALYEKQKPELRGPITTFDQFEEYCKEYGEKHPVYLRLNAALENDKSDFECLRMSIELLKSKGDKEKLASIYEKVKRDYAQCHKRFKRMQKTFLLLHNELLVIKQHCNEFAEKVRP